jgi:hypothetical protein
MALRVLPDQSYLLQKFDYNPQTGVLRWQSGLRQNRASGKIISRLDSDGYIRLGLDGNYHRAHRIIWKMMTGEDASTLIDHIDTNKVNNRWDNLRLATMSENQRNRTKRFGRRIVRDPSTGLWRAYVYLGTHATKDEADAAIEKAMATDWELSAVPPFL